MNAELQDLSLGHAETTAPSQHSPARVTTNNSAAPVAGYATGTETKVAPAVGKLSATTYMLLKNAQVLEDHGELTLAFHILRQAANEQSWDQRILSQLSKLLLTQKRYDEALKVSQQLLKKYPCFETMTLTGHILYRLERDQEALERYFEALSILTSENNELFEIYKNMGNIYVKMRDFDGAEEYYNKAHTITPNSDTLFVNYGTLEFQKGDFEKSRMCFRQAIEINSQNDRAWAGLAMVHSQYNDLELALGNVLKAVEINPCNRTAHILASEWMMNQKQWGSCIELLQEYVYANDYDEDLSLRLIHCFCELRKFDMAQIELVRCLAWNPENEHLWKVKDLLAKQ